MRRVRIALPFSLVVVAGALVLTTDRLETAAASPYPAVPSPIFSPAAAQLPSQASQSDLLTEVELPVEFAFHPGETLGQVLGGLGLDAGEVEAVTSELSRHADPRRLRPVDRYAALLDSRSNLQGVQLTLAGRGRVRALRDDGHWRSAWLPFVRESKVRSLDGELEESLEASIRGAGGEPLLAYEMADVLQWDLDFTRDLRRGDHFEVLYEEVYLDGSYDSVGDVLALAYENRGRRLEAYRFGDDGGYYDGEGRPLRKMFLRSPLRYSRITSRFSQRRFHPVLKSYRPHYGVDYGAPTGTPVRVTANGVVAFAGWDRGGGRTVKVRHPNDYLTAYLHLSRFAAGVHSGRRVVQGDVIGYVGSTGLATAPHLDYRVQQHGRWIDPLSLESTPAEPIPPNRLPEFLAWRDRLRTSLSQGVPLDLPAVPAGDQVAAAPAVDAGVPGPATSP